MNTLLMPLAQEVRRMLDLHEISLADVFARADRRPEPPKTPFRLLFECSNMRCRDLCWGSAMLVERPSSSFEKQLKGLTALARNWMYGQRSKMDATTVSRVRTCFNLDVESQHLLHSSGPCPEDRFKDLHRVVMLGVLLLYRLKPHSCLEVSRDTFLLHVADSGGMQIGVRGNDFVGLGLPRGTAYRRLGSGLDLTLDYIPSIAAEWYAAHELLEKSQAPDEYLKACRILMHSNIPMGL